MTLFAASLSALIYTLALAWAATDRLAMFTPPTEPRVVRFTAWQYRLYGWWVMPLRDAWFRYVIGPPKH